MAKDDTIELEGADGSTFHCRVLDILEFRGKDYGVLLNLETEDPVLMEFIDEGDSGKFRVIEDDDEFETVAAFVRALADGA